MPVRRPSRLRPSGPAWGHNPWKCPYGSCPTSLIPSILPSTPPFPTMLLFSSSPPQAGGVWTTQRDLAARGGIQGGAPGPQVRPELNLPPSILPLPPPPLGASFTNPPPPRAQQANQAISVPCNLGTRGAEEGRRVIAEQAGRGPMWTSCPSETLPGSVSPSPPRLITSLIFINSWGFFMPCRPEIDREGGMETEVEGVTPLHSTTTTTMLAAGATKTTTSAAGAQC